RRAGRVWRSDERPDVGDAERSEDLLAFRRREPMLLILHVVVADHSWHAGSSVGVAQRKCWARSEAYACGVAGRGRSWTRWRSRQLGYGSQHVGEFAASTALRGAATAHGCMR